MGLDHLEQADEARSLCLVLIVVAVSGGHAPFVAVARWTLSCLCVDGVRDGSCTCRRKRHDVAAPDAARPGKSDEQRPISHSCQALSLETNVRCSTQESMSGTDY